MKRIIVVSVLLLSIALAVENLEVNPINIQPKDKSQVIIDATSPIDIQSKIEPDVITVPKMLNYQGKLTNLAGVPVADSTYSITFRLYNTSTGGSAFWTEPQVVQTHQGIFNVLLGSIIPIETIPQDGNCYLEMQINPNPAMTPRIRLVSSAYAYLSKKSDTANYALSANVNYVDSARISTNAHKLQGKDTNALSNKFVDEGQTNAITNIMIVDNAITSSKIQDGTIQLVDLAFTPATRPLTPPVSNAEIQDNAITSSKIQDNAVVSAKIQDNAITSSKIQDNAVIGSKIQDNAITSSKIQDNAVVSAKIQDNAVISSKIQDGTILRQDVASNFKAPYADTADYARNVNIQYVDSARVSVNAYNAYKLQGKDTIALDSRYVNEGQVNSITNAMITSNAVTTDKILDGTITRSDVSPIFKAPLADTADYARYLPGAIDSARVSANSHKLQGKDTIALSAKFVDEGQTNSISSPMIIDGTITNTDISATAGISDTKLAGSGTLITNLNADLLDGQHASAFALSGHTHTYIDSARVSANTHNAYKLQGKDTIALSNKFVDENQANSITSAMIVDGNVTMSKIHQAGATTGQVLKWTGSAWAPRNDSIGNGLFLPLSGGTMTGPITSTGDPEIKMGKGNFGSNNRNPGTQAFVAGSNNSALGAYSVVSGGGGPNFSDSNAAVGNYSTIGGGSKNIGSGNYATIGGGDNNFATGLYSTISGGKENMAFNNYVTISGGYHNNSQGLHGTIGGGIYNFAGGNYATISGGSSNTADGVQATISGGGGNIAGDTGATVGGGLFNRARGRYAVVAGGGGSNPADSNSAYGDWSVVSGGFRNRACSSYSTVSGGFDNLASNIGATIGGGFMNVVHGSCATISGGSSNLAIGAGATVGGGVDVTAHSPFSGVFSGYDNVAGNELLDTCAVIVGGENNNAVGKYTFIGGGRHNRARGNYSVIAGGGGPTYADSNSTLGNWATVSGGNRNSASGSYATVGGGSFNSASAWYATIGGGTMNYAISDRATIGGGGNNNANAPYATVSGGLNNWASGNRTTIGGGESNHANGEFATIGGGLLNEITNNYSTVSGGTYNTASGVSSTVGGGYANSASGYYSMVAGGREDTSAAHYSFTTNYASKVPSAYSSSAAFNGQTASASSQLRCGALVGNSKSFQIDHPLDPNGKFLNHFSVESPKLLVTYDGVAFIGSDGRVVVNLPDYFSALTKDPRIQLTGVGTSDVYVAEDITGNQFVIGGKANTKVYWQVTAERKDVSAEITKILMPVEQEKTGELRGVSADDNYLMTTLDQLQEMGYGNKFNFRTQRGRQRYDNMKRMEREAEIRH